MRLEEFFDKFFEDIEGIGVSGERFKESGGRKIMNQSEIDNRSFDVTQNIRQPSYLSWVFSRFIKLGTAKKVSIEGKTGYVPGPSYDEHLKMGRERRQHKGKGV